MERGADYREMYLTMARGVERAVNELIQVQRQCEEIYVQTADGEGSDEAQKELCERRKEI